MDKETADQVQAFIETLRRDFFGVLDDKFDAQRKDLVKLIDDKFAVHKADMDARFDGIAEEIADLRLDVRDVRTGLRDLRTNVQNLDERIEQLEGPKPVTTTRARRAPRRKTSK